MIVPVKTVCVYQTFNNLKPILKFLLDRCTLRRLYASKPVEIHGELYMSFRYDLYLPQLTEGCKEIMLV